MCEGEAPPCLPRPALVADDCEIPILVPSLAPLSMADSTPENAPAGNASTWNAPAGEQNFPAREEGVSLPQSGQGSKVVEIHAGLDDHVVWGTVSCSDACSVSAFVFGYMDDQFSDCILHLICTGEYKMRPWPLACGALMHVTGGQQEHPSVPLSRHKLQQHETLGSSTAWLIKQVRRVVHHLSLSSRDAVVL